MRIAQWLLLWPLLSWSSACDRLPQAGTTRPTPPSPTSSISPPGAILSLGQTAVLTSQRIKLVSQRACDTGTEGGSRALNRSWAVELEVTNTDAKPIPVSPFYATLEDPQSFTYITSLTGCAPLLPARLAQPGETVRGYVPFVLPRNTAVATLAYRPAARAESGSSARFHVEP